MTNTQEEFSSRFNGFDRPRGNFYRLPLEWFDLWRVLRQEKGKRSCLGPIKIVEYVLKHTWGEQDFGGSVKLSLTDFERGRNYRRYADLGTRLTRTNASQAIQFCITKNLITVEVDDRDKARINKRYRAKIKSAPEAPDAENTMRLNAEDIPQLGFDDPQSNYFIVPMVWTDVCAQISSEVQILCVEYFFLHAWNFRRHEDSEITWLTATDVCTGRRYKSKHNLDGSAKRYDQGTGFHIDIVRKQLDLCVQSGLLVRRQIRDGEGLPMEEEFALRKSGFPSGNPYKKRSFESQKGDFSYLYDKDYHLSDQSGLASDQKVPPSDQSVLAGDQSVPANDQKVPPSNQSVLASDQSVLRSAGTPSSVPSLENRHKSPSSIPISASSQSLSINFIDDEDEIDIVIDHSIQKLLSYLNNLLDDVSNQEKITITDWTTIQKALQEVRLLPQAWLTALGVPSDKAQSAFVACHVLPNSTEILKAIWEWCEVVSEKWVGRQQKLERLLQAITSQSERDELCDHFDARLQVTSYPKNWVGFSAEENSSNRPGVISPTDKKLTLDQTRELFSQTMNSNQPNHGAMIKVWHDAILDEFVARTFVNDWLVEQKVYPKLRQRILEQHNDATRLIRAVWQFCSEKQDSLRDAKWGGVVGNTFKSLEAVEKLFAKYEERFNQNKTHETMSSKKSGNKEAHPDQTTIAIDLLRWRGFTQADATKLAMSYCGEHDLNSIEYLLGWMNYLAENKEKLTNEMGLLRRRIEAGEVPPRAENMDTPAYQFASWREDMLLTYAEPMRDPIGEFNKYQIIKASENQEQQKIKDEALLRKLENDRVLREATKLRQQQVDAETATKIKAEAESIWQSLFDPQHRISDTAVLRIGSMMRKCFDELGMRELLTRMRLTDVTPEKIMYYLIDIEDLKAMQFIYSAQNKINNSLNGTITLEYDKSKLNQNLYNLVFKVRMALLREGTPLGLNSDDWTIPTRIEEDTIWLLAMPEFSDPDALAQKFSRILSSKLKREVAVCFEAQSTPTSSLGVCP